MRRTNKPRWRKTGGGVFVLLGGRTIQPGETFRANPEEIPQAFRDTIIPVDNVEEQEEEPEPVSGFEVRHKGGGWYDVVNLETNEAVNDQSMRLDEAEDLMRKANGGGLLQEPEEPEEPEDE